MNLFNLQKNKIFKKGFTILELLVVIAIIGVLSAVVMASISSARSKANTTAYIESLNQMSKLMEIEYSTYGTYGGLFSNMWMADNPSLFAPGLVVTCDSIYSGKTSKYKDNALAICKKISNLTNNDTYFGIFLWSADSPTKVYSISGTFNGKIYCIGSNGKSLPSSSGYNGIGCANNP